MKKQLLDTEQRTPSAGERNPAAEGGTVRKPLDPGNWETGKPKDGLSGFPDAAGEGDEGAGGTAEECPESQPRRGRRRSGIRSRSDEKPVRKKKKRRRKNYLLRILLTAGVLGGLYYFSTTSAFDVSAVTVKNNSYYTAEQIIRISGAKTGGNLFRADTRGMKKKLLKKPHIKNASVRRTLPGTITITVIERREAAAVPYGGIYVILDENGLVLRHAETEPSLPLFIGMTIRKMRPGEPLSVEETAVLTETLYLLQETERSDMYFKKIDITDVLIKAYIYDQLVCEGTPENILANMKNGNIQSVVQELFEKGIQRGVIKVGSGNYCAFSPQVETPGP